MQALAQSLLVRGIRAASVSLVERSLAMGADVNRNHEGCNYLPMAVKMGHVAIVKLLLDGGAQMDAVDHSESRALYGLMMRGNYDMFEILVLHGANVHVQVHQSVPLLTLALQHDNPAFAMLLVQSGAMARMTFGDQMRMISSHMHSLDLLRCMLSACPRVDAALLIETAAKQDQIEAIREIVVHCGIPVPRENETDEDGNKTGDLIQCLIRQRFHKAVGMLISLGAPVSSRHLTTAIASIPMTHWLVYREARPPRTMNYEQYHHQTVAQLIKAGCGNRAILVDCILNGRHLIVDMLVSHGHYRVDDYESLHAKCHDDKMRHIIDRAHRNALFDLQPRFACDKVIDVQDISIVVP